MRELKYFVACSVDGFIAARDGSTDAFVNDEDYFAELFEAFPETCPGHLRQALVLRGENRHFDTVLMGRKTYEPGLKIDLTSPSRPSSSTSSRPRWGRVPTRTSRSSRGTPPGWRGEDRQALGQRRMARQPGRSHVPTRQG
jgi:hypothetical protein